MKKGLENCYLGIKRDFRNISNRLTQWLIHPSILRGYSSEKFSKSHSVAI